MLIDQYAMGALDAHVAHYVKEAGTFFKDMDRIKEWGGNVSLYSKIAIFGLIAVMGFVGTVALSKYLLRGDIME